jgi:asparagine synthase (glutamine-hydrolysing)
MCGICGKLMSDREAIVPLALLKGMANAIIHRGPDDEGFFTSGPVGLGFRRLSIIDLAGGHQPLCNEDNTIWIVFNGEIYNYQELRAFLLTKGHTFRTQSDTEVIVHLYEELGEKCVEKLRGMFGFAIWDGRNNLLFLARDRVGIKPLYYCQTPSGLLFASEIKAILADPSFPAEVEPMLIDRFLTFDYMPGEETLFRGIRKLSPGTCLVAQNGQIRTRQYWDLQFRDSGLSEAQAELQLVEMLEESARLHMISDVPVGFLLSGGLDSTAMLSLAVGKTDKRLSSFTVGFSEPGVIDERPFAKLAADTYGSDHHEITISSKDFADFLPKYVWHMEEPVCEPPAIALYYISKLAREFVTVLISGEGGDEAFAGYPNYRSGLWLETLKSKMGWALPLVTGPISLANRFLQNSRIAKYNYLLSHHFDSYYLSRTATPERFTKNGYSQIYEPAFSQTLDKEVTLSPLRKLQRAAPTGDIVNRMLYIDTKTWLPDDLLIKADKITMANSIELRVPLLDHEVLEFAASLPANLKVRGITTKYLAKKALGKRVPEPIINRRKAGFPTPYAAWLKKDLKARVRDILLDSRTRARGYFQHRTIQKMLDESLVKDLYAKEIFSLVVLELWHREFVDHKCSSIPSNDLTNHQELKKKPAS